MERKGSGDAEQLLREGKISEAYELLLEIVKKSPDNAQAWYLLGGIYRRQQLWGDAINAYNKAKMIEPDGPADAAIESIYDIIRFVNADLMNP
jgi:Putative Zn-dependent protease, contains TPR repeats